MLHCGPQARSTQRRHGLGQTCPKLEPKLAAYARTIMAMPEMVEWIEAAKAEPADIEELEVEY